MLDSAMPDPTTPTNRLSRLRDIIAAKSMRKGTFTLASGRASDIFFDLKPAMLDPEGADIIAENILARLADGPADYIGGLEMGAVPIVALVSVKSWPAAPIPAFFVRKAIKDHGTRERVEGNIEADSDVVLLEDVTTTGGSVLDAVKVVREKGCRVARVITIVDRLEGAGENLAGHGIDLVALLTRNDFD